MSVDFILLRKTPKYYTRVIFLDLVKEKYIPDVLPGGLSPEGPATALLVGICNQVNHPLDPRDQRTQIKNMDKQKLTLDLELEPI